MEKIWNMEIFLANNYVKWGLFMVKSWNFQNKQLIKQIQGVWIIAFYRLWKYLQDS